MNPDKSFKLGTTSFIYPDHIIPNVKKLGPFFDEIELLIFESQPEFVLPSKADVQSLRSLSQSLDLTYNIHLPLDVNLASGGLVKQQKAADTLLRVMDRFYPLTPTTHTLHLEIPADVKKNMKNQTRLAKWTDNVCQGLELLLNDIADPSIISIETLDYPFSLIEFLVLEFNLSVCIDAGHQIKYNTGLVQTFETHKSRTPIIHLHGVAFGDQDIKDHTSLDQLPKKYFRQVQRILEQFRGVVSLEVFNIENLNRSLLFLSMVFNHIAPNIDGKWIKPNS